MLQLSRHAAVAANDAASRQRLRAAFAAQHWIKLHNVLDPNLLADVQARLAAATFVERTHPGVVPPSVDLSMVPNTASGLLELVFNDDAVRGLVAEVSQCGPIARFGGFVYRLDARSGLEHHWHNDLVEGRLVAMSVNLGPDRYAGGTLQLRERATSRVIAEVANDVPGDALLFRIDARLQHRARPVTDGVKTAFAGWFFGGMGYADVLRAGGAAS